MRFPEEIPEDWRVDAQKLRPEIDAQATFTKMRCWLGANNTTTKTMQQWKTQFLGWIGREKKGFGHYAGNHRADRAPGLCGLQHKKHSRNRLQLQTPGSRCGGMSALGKDFSLSTLHLKSLRDFKA